MYGTSGQLFITASSAIGGGGGSQTLQQVLNYSVAGAQIIGNISQTDELHIQENNIGAGVHVYGADTTQNKSAFLGITTGGSTPYVGFLHQIGTNYIIGNLTSSNTTTYKPLGINHSTGELVDITDWPSSPTASYATNFTIDQTLTLNQTLTRRGNVNSTSVGNNSFDQATGSFTSAHGKYTVYKGTNARAGEFVTVWNGTTTTYYDNATTDIGNTSDITFTSVIASGDVKIIAVAASSGWTVKMLITYI